MIVATADGNCNGCTQPDFSDAFKSVRTRSRAPDRLSYKILSQVNHRRLQALLQPYDLTPFHWLVLRILWYENGLPVSNITVKLQEVGGTMTGVIDRMEERGLVSRVRDPADRRILRVFLTKKGQELESEILPLIEQSRKQLVRGTAARDLATFERVAEQMMENCRDMLEAD